MMYRVASGATGGGPQCAAAAAFLRLVLGVLVLLSASATRAQTPPVPGDVSVTTENGFARLLFHLRTEVGASIRLANNILIVDFAAPVDVNVDRLNTNAPDYVSAARLDPDGRAVRIALARKVKASLKPAGERLFLDLLPDTWTGLAPGLPQRVVEELARRVREAEKRARLQQQLANWKKVPPIRVRVATQPTFTRYTFPLSNIVAVASDRGPDGLTLAFDAPLRFDFADALVALPSFITSIEPKLDEDAASVRFAFNGKVDVRTFREDNNYVVDVAPTALGRSTGDAVSRAIEELQRTVPDAERAAHLPAMAPQAVPHEHPAAAAVLGEPGAQPRTALDNPEAAVTPKAAPSRQGPPAATVRSVIETTPAALPPPPVRPETPASPAADTARAKRGGSRSAQELVRSVKAEIKRYDDAIRILFPFTVPTPSAVFRRADVIWLVFDSETPVDVGALQGDPNGPIRGVMVSRTDGQVIRLKLDRPRLASLVMEGNGWAVTISDSIANPSKPIVLTRTIVGPARASIVIPFENARRLHRISDPEVGDTLLVVSALGPVRGLVKQQEFLELRALASIHGIAIQPLADDIIVQVSPDRTVVGRPDGLSLSAHVSGVRRSGGEAALLDIERWARDRDSDFFSRRSQLINAAVAAPPEQRWAKRLNIAQFYLAREMFYEAKGALDMALSAEHPKADESSLYVLRAVAKLMCGRTGGALKDLAHPSVGNQHDAPLWRTVARAEEGQWAEARKGFNAAQMSIGTLPVELQRYVLLVSARAALEVGDVDSAAAQLNDFETIGAPPDLQPELALLRGRIAERLGRSGDALAAYRTVLDSNDRRAAVQARLRQTMLRMRTDDFKRVDAIGELETISVIWRGDETEIETLQLLGRLYTEEGRLRDAFGVMRAALTADPKSDRTRSIQDAAAATFESVFLSGKGEALSAIDALSLFYDFRDLTPMGRRGDEMIRRLADRLVAIDLLDQASELLQHQVDKRLQGAARAQVATRLAMIYLMNNKPDRALNVLRATHVAGFSDTLRNRRLLLESRALSELGRTDVALEAIANLRGREAERLRADVLWKSRRWRQAAEQIERVLGERWRDWQPLDGAERNDVLRAGIGYALGEDSIGLRRLRERYAAKMIDGPDRRAFEVVTGPLGPASAEFSAIATNVGSVNTLERFLSDLRAGFSDLAASTDPLSQPQRNAPAGAALSNAALEAVAPTIGQAPAMPVAPPSQP